MDDNKVLTVIVPVYNSEKYLGRCLDSLISQCTGGLIDKYEILCINDGSTDKSGGILNSYESQYPRIVRTITQENRGVIAARNRGLDEARGEIVTFCDNDDYIIPGAYAYMLEHFWSNDTDVLQFQAITLDRYVMRTWKEANDPSGKIEYKGKGREAYQHPFLAAVWNHFFRKSFLDKHKLRLPKVIITEDSQFILDVYMANPNVVVCSSCVYRYTVSPEQVTSGRKVAKMRKMLPDYISEFKKYTNYMNNCEDEERALSECLKMRRYSCGQQFVSRILSADLSKKDYDSLFSELKEIEYLPFPYKGKIARGFALVASNFYSYKIMSMLFTKLFVPFVLPRLPRT